VNHKSSIKATYVALLVFREAALEVRFCFMPRPFHSLFYPPAPPPTFNSANKASLLKGRFCNKTCSFSPSCSHAVEKIINQHNVWETLKKDRWSKHWDLAVILDYLPINLPLKLNFVNVRRNLAWRYLKMWLMCATTCWIIWNNTNIILTQWSWFVFLCTWNHQQVLHQSCDQQLILHHHNLWVPHRVSKEHAGEVKINVTSANVLSLRAELANVSCMLCQTNSLMTYFQFYFTIYLTMYGS